MIWSALVAALALAVLVVAPATAAARRSCGHAGAAPKRLSLAEMRRSELCLINRARARRHLHRLAFNADLRKSAARHSVSMVARGYFAHKGPGGSVGRRVSRAGYLHRARAFTIGENIAAGSGHSGSPRAIFRDWMRSAPHRANILDPSYRDAGVGVVRGLPFGGAWSAATYTVDFGARHGG